MTIIELGNIGSKEQVEKIKTALAGKTYMNLRVDYGIYADNYPVIVSTAGDYTEKELTDMVLFALATSL